MDEPLAVALKFGFLAVLYLFLLWIARSAMKDLSRAGGGTAAAEPVDAPGPRRRESALPDLRAGVE
ncbi:MAG: FHA domain-containing protein, partial [Thermoleophilaceae bacterium]